MLTKLDVLTGLKEIPICVAYDVDGERHDDMPTDQAAFAAAKPIYETMPGWMKTSPTATPSTSCLPPARPTSSVWKS